MAIDPRNFYHLIIFTLQHRACCILHRKLQSCTARSTRAIYVPSTIICIPSRMKIHHDYNTSFAIYRLKQGEDFPIIFQVMVSPWILKRWIIWRWTTANSLEAVVSRLYQTAVKR